MMRHVLILASMLFVPYQGSHGVDAPLPLEAITALLETRERSMQEFSVELAIRTQFRESTEGPPPWPMGLRSGTWQFAYSHGKMRLSGRWKLRGEVNEHEVNAEFDGAATTRVKGGADVFFGDITPEASACFPDGTFPLDYVVTVQRDPISSITSHLRIVSESALPDLVLESTPRTDDSGYETKLQVELEPSRGYALRRSATLMRAAGSTGDWLVNAEYLVKTWFPEQDGLSLPESATYKQVSLENVDVTDGIQQTALMTAKELQFSSWRLGTVSFDEVTIPDGTPVEDRMKGSRFVTRKVTGEDVMDATGLPTRTGSGMARTILVVFTVVIVCAVAGLWFYRRS